ncbi:MAG TPA: DUF3793 family protein [Lachnospiraceae bacterium]|nr:DUF3793 family protein [Lachnospiraceae bacterium]
MSRQVFELIRQMDIQDPEFQLAFQCAPLISGLKISNLLVIRPEKLDEVKQILRNTDISYSVLSNTEEKAVILLYKQELLAAYLSMERVKKLLLRMGYRADTLDTILPVFCIRYRKYVREKREFPHELGILLGYPIEDVEGFIDHNGRDFLFSGYWKVYENMPAKERLFQRFEHVKETMLQMIFCGMSIVDIIDIYSDRQIEKTAV